MSRIWVRLWLYILVTFWILLICLEIPTTLVTYFLPRDNDVVLFVVDLLGILLLSVLFTALLARILAQPLNALARAARQVAEGDLSARAGVRKERFPLNTLQRGEVDRLLYDFNAMATSLERLETERLATTAAIAHELRTPIAVLRARLAALQDGVFKLDGREIPLLIQQTDLLARLVDDLRYLSLADAGKLELFRSACDVSILAREVAASFEPRAAAQGVKLNLALESVVVICDEGRVRQIISNLVDNALKFTPRDGVITLVVKAVSRGATLSVQDTGPGLAKGEEERLFKRFYRGESSPPGSGLGLAIVKTLVALHGGEVEATRAPEGGVLIHLFLPEQPPLASPS